MDPYNPSVTGMYDINERESTDDFCQKAMAGSLGEKNKNVRVPRSEKKWPTQTKNSFQVKVLKSEHVRGGPLITKRNYETGEA